MKYLSWSQGKNELLKAEREISFEEIALLIEAGNILGVEENQGHPNQKSYILEIGNYAYIVSFVESENEIFLKTAFPSRKYTKRFGLKVENLKKLKQKAFEPLDKEESDLMKSLENQEWQSVKDLEQQKQAAVEAARNTLKKDKRINLRLSPKDYHEIQIRAVEEGIPYQTLISSIIHKYLNGLLLPKQ